MTRKRSKLRPEKRKDPTVRGLFVVAVTVIEDVSGDGALLEVPVVWLQAEEHPDVQALSESKPSIDGFTTGWSQQLVRGLVIVGLVVIPPAELLTRPFVALMALEEHRRGLERAVAAGRMGITTQPFLPTADRSLIQSGFQVRIDGSQLRGILETNATT